MTEQFGLFDSGRAGPPGFRYRADMLSEREEQDFAAVIAQLPFAPFEFHGFLGRRRTVSFGLRYGFDGSGLAAADPIPDALLPLRDLAARFAGVDPAAFAHMLVTEYAPGAGIGWHKDRSVFGETVGISLLAPCRLRFRRRTGVGWDRSAIMTAPRSAYLLSGEARSAWEHSIPPLAQLRYSITLRTLAISSRSGS